MRSYFPYCDRWTFISHHCRRIGLAPNVSSHTPAQQLDMSVTPSKPSALPATHPYLHPTPAPAPTTITESSDGPSDARPPPGGGNFNTAPTNFGRAAVDEFGTRVRATSIDQPGVQTIGGSGIAPATTSGVATPRSPGRATAPTANRLTVTNFAEDMPEEVRQNMAQMAAQKRHQRQTSASARPSGSASASASASGGQRSGWMNAEEEKRMLYERAKAQVEQVQGAPRAQSPPLEVCVLGVCSGTGAHLAFRSKHRRLSVTPGLF